MQSNTTAYKKDNLPENKQVNWTSTDPFNILGLTKDAKPDVIRKVYRQLLLKNHPDKVRSEDVVSKELANERTKILNRAYKILTDEKEREIWKATQAKEAPPEDIVTNYPRLITTSERPSESFKRYFQDIEKLFQTSPLQPLSKAEKQTFFVELNNLSENKSLGEKRYQQLYRTEESKEKTSEFPDVYQFVDHMHSAKSTPIDAALFKDNLTPEKAIDFLLKFLTKQFYGENLKKVQTYFQREISRLYQLENPLVTLYRSILAILSVSSSQKEYQTILNSVQGIYSFFYQKNAIET